MSKEVPKNTGSSNMENKPTGEQKPETEGGVTPPEGKDILQENILKEPTEESKKSLLVRAGAKQGKKKEKTSEEEERIEELGGELRQESGKQKKAENQKEKQEQPPITPEPEEKEAKREEQPNRSFGDQFKDAAKKAGKWAEEHWAVLFLGLEESADLARAIRRPLERVRGSARKAINGVKENYEKRDKVKEQKRLELEDKKRLELEEQERQKEERAKNIEQRKAAREKEIQSRIETRASPYSKLSYKNLFNKIISTEDKAESDKLIEEQNKRIGELIKMKILPEEIGDSDISDHFTHKIIDTIQWSSWDEKDTKNYYENKLDELARNLEFQASLDQRYKSNPRYEGAVYEAVRSVVNRVQYEGLVKRREDFKSTKEYEDYLIKKEYNRLSLYELGKMLKASVINFGYVNLAAYVGSKKPKSGEDVYERLKGEGIERPQPTAPPKEEVESKKPISNETTADSVEEGMKRLRLSEKQELDDFLERERWSDNLYDFDKKENLYYKGIADTRERQIFEWRVWLHWAMATRQDPDKNRGSWGAETFAANGAMKRIPQEALPALTSSFPGTETAIRLYQKLTKSDDIPKYDFISSGFEPPKRYRETDKDKYKEENLSLKGCILREEINVYRKMVEERIFDDFRKQLLNEKNSSEGSEEKARQQARNAEQIGWNLWVVQGGFDRESIWEGINIKTGERETLTDSSDQREYSDIIRVRGPKISQSAVDMMHKPIRSFLNPMDAIIDMATRKDAEDKEQKVGGLYDWAARNIRESLKNVGVNNLDKFYQDGGFDKVVIINDNDEKKYWRIDNNKGKYTLYLPQFIPVRTVGSYFEHTSALDPDDNFKEKKLAEFIKNDKPIPWKYTKGGFSSYLVDTSYWVNVWGILDYETAKKGGEDEDVVLDILGSVGRGEDKSLFRWIRYYHKGVFDSQRLPHMRVDLDRRRNFELMRESYLRKKDTERADRYSREKLFFPWDRKAPKKDKLERWWRETTGLG